jgi:hypothetical protein
VLNGHIEQLRGEFEENERRYKLQGLELINKIDNLQETSFKAERLNCDLNKEILKQRVQFEQIELELHLENENLRNLNVQKAKSLAELEYNIQTEKKKTENLIEEQTIQYSKGFKSQCRKSEDETEAIKQKYKALQTDHLEKMKKLESELTELKRK